ncbi:hypothetical protein NE237_021512 [Protea cynaroides]|uniref:Uncharacterized protein n=1 Tax=Protea cynaroides TaxID=273540 RepID=A0A9Q0HCI5_9MAGN|nr:hypothetical protein NE237_021512 [Protea cynaroides]
MATHSGVASELSATVASELSTASGGGAGADGSFAGLGFGTMSPSDGALPLVTRTILTGTSTGYGRGGDQDSGLRVEKSYPDSTVNPNFAIASSSLGGRGAVLRRIVWLPVNHRQWKFSQQEKGKDVTVDSVLPVSDEVVIHNNDASPEEVGVSKSPPRKELWSDIADKDDEQMPNVKVDGEITPPNNNGADRCSHEVENSNAEVNTINASRSGQITTTTPGMVEVSFHEVEKIDRMHGGSKEPFNSVRRTRGRLKKQIESGGADDPTISK